MAFTAGAAAVALLLWLADLRTKIAPPNDHSPHQAYLMQHSHSPSGQPLGPQTPQQQMPPLGAAGQQGMPLQMHRMQSLGSPGPQQQPPPPQSAFGLVSPQGSLLPPGMSSPPQPLLPSPRSPPQLQSPPHMQQQQQQMQPQQMQQQQSMQQMPGQQGSPPGHADNKPALIMLKNKHHRAEASAEEVRAALTALLSGLEAPCTVTLLPQVTPQTCLKLSGFWSLTP